MITKALVIDEPWISKILGRQKTWEMRSGNSRFRGLFGLVRKGSGKVVGIARLNSVSGPHSNQELCDTISLHQVDRSIFEQPGYKWRYAWELTDIITLDREVSYVHKNGAVTWVELDETAIEGIAKQLNRPREVLHPSRTVDTEMTRLFGETAPSNQHCIGQKRSPMDVADAQVVNEAPTVEKASLTAVLNGRVPEASGSPMQAGNAKRYVPQARDGSCFTTALRNARGLYTVGEKGDEQKFRDYPEALSYLKGMSVAKWRRPNQRGNWGIVSAVDWVIDGNENQ